MKLAVQLSNVTVDYQTVIGLKDVSWTINHGSHAVVLGPNGCGKSSLLRTITAYGRVTSGTVRVLGEQIGKTNVHELRRRLGVVDPTLVRLLDSSISAAQLVATGFYGHLTSFFDRPTSSQLEEAESWMADLGLADHIRQPFTTLSSGQQARTWLARAMISQPELLILDEPMAGLDLRARETLLATLDSLTSRRQELTTLMVTHHLEELLPNVTNVLLLARGQTVAAGEPKNVLTEANLEAAFECPVTVGQHQDRWFWHVSPDAWDRLLGKPSL